MTPISIIIPTLNRYDLLARLLDGIAIWPTQPDEIIIVDQTTFVIGPGDYPDLSNSQRNIRHVKVDFRGPCKARNTGAKLAQGDMLWFLDDDMSPVTEMDLVTYIQRHFDKFPYSALTGTHSIDSSYRTPAEMSTRFDVFRYLTLNWNQFADECRFSLGLLGGNVAIPKPIFFELSGFDEKFDPDGAFEDRDLGLRCFQKGIMVFQSQRIYLEHLQASSGGRRENSQRANLAHFWSKYMSEDMYYVQAYSHWLSQTRWSIWRNLVKHFALRVLRVPPYRAPINKALQ